MSNLWVNISFGIWYLQIGPDAPVFLFKAHPHPHMLDGKPWFAIHNLFGWRP
jgi:hypothetical protein